MRVSKYFILILLGVSFFTPLVYAIPEIRDISESAYTVTASDSVVITCGPGIVFSARYGGPVSFRLVAPDGTEMTFTLTTPQASYCTTDSPITHPTCNHSSDAAASTRWSSYSLSGANTGGGRNPYTASGSVVGATGDGTWTLYDGLHEDIPNTAYASTICLYVNNKQYTFRSQGDLAPPSCIWNYHEAPVGEYESVGTCFVSGSEPAPEDPDKALFYGPAGGPSDTNPHPFTSGAESNPVPEPSTAVLVGTWLGGENQIENTFTRFVYVYGVVTATDTDLRDNFGVQSTPLADRGPGQVLGVPNDGIDTASISYPGTQGVSFQYMARAGPTGPEQLGVVMAIAPDANYAVATVSATVTCPVNMALLGSWSGTGGSITVRFAVAQGSVGTLTDLRTDPTVTYTTPFASTSSVGTRSETVTNYNNLAGNRVQFMVTQSGIEYLGNVLTVAQAQCTSTNPGIAIAEAHDENIFELRISHAQCLGDNVTFNMNLELGSALIVVSDLDLFILDSGSGVTLAAIDDSTMNAVGNRIFYDELLIGAGGYLAFAKVDLSGVGSADYWDAESFVVPMETCKDSPTDLNPVLNLINTRTAQTNSYINTTTQEVRNDLNIVHQHIDSHFNTTYALINLVHQHIDSHFNETVENFTLLLSNICTGNQTCAFNITVDNTDVLTEIQTMDTEIGTNLALWFWLAIVTVTVVIMNKENYRTNFILPILSLFGMFFAYNNFESIFRTFGIAVGILLLTLYIWRLLKENEKKKGEVNV